MPDDATRREEADATARARWGDRRPPPVDTLLRCLLKLARHHKRPIGEADLRASVPIPDGGMTPDTFLRAAQRLGYRARRDPIDVRALRAIPLPFVLVGREGGGRLVVGRAGDRLTVVDPVDDSVREETVAAALAAGREAILVKPLSDLAPRLHWRALIGERLRGVLWELVLASTVINLLALATPLFVMTLYNKVIPQSALDTLDVLAIGMLALFAFEVILRAARGYVSSHAGARIDSVVGAEVLHRLLHQPFRHFESTPSGLIAERLRQLDVIRTFFTGPMPLLLVDLAFVSLFVVALLFISPVLGAITVVAMPIYFVVSVVFHRSQGNLVERNFGALAAKTSTLNETLANALTIKSLGLEPEIEKRWESRLAAAAWTGFQASNLGNVIAVIGNLLQQLTALVLIFVGARMIMAGELTIGALIAAAILSSRALAPVRQIVTAWKQVQEVRAAFRRLDAIMGGTIEDYTGEVAPSPPLKGDIEFEHVGFAYAEDLPPALQDVTFAMPNGQILGLVGPPGSGKSTLVKLLQGLYPPGEGRVLIDETDIAHLSSAALRRQIGMVPQENQLFAGTVRENVLMGFEAEPETVVAVCRFVGAHEFIQRLPRGYDTVLTERGAALSAGQRQLLCIARALVRNPRILVLDEATSALDAATEEALLQNLRRASRGRTILIVTHRIAPLLICDRVALLIGGRIERIGPPTEVIAFTRARMGQASPPVAR